MEAQDIIEYCARMEDIKRRIAAVNYLLSFPESLSKEACIESVYLQYRKILEQIAFGSLISNREKFSKAYKRFSNYWHAADLLRDLERVNKHFYPEPVTEAQYPKPGIRVHIEGKKAGFLTKGEFLELYGRSGDILHERNPYAGPPDSDWFLKTAPQWLEKIVGLVNTHLVHLYGSPKIYLIHMNAPGQAVHHYTLEPTV